MTTERIIRSCFDCPAYDYGLHGPAGPRCQAFKGHPDGMPLDEPKYLPSEDRIEPPVPPRACPLRAGAMVLKLETDS